MKKSYLKKLWVRYNRGKATRVERFIIERWYASFDFDAPVPFWLKDQQSIHDFEDRVLQTMFRNSNQGSYSRWWLRIAAIMALGCFSVVLYRTVKEQNNQAGTVALRVVRTGAGEIKKLLLPDSTAVFLNANSRLTIQASFGKKERTVSLSGEAFFDVKKDQAHPFLVHMGKLDVRVLGTSFNINSYELSERIKIAVSTGKIHVSEPGHALTELSKGEQLAYYKSTGKIEQSTLQGGIDPSWIQGNPVLDRASFDELAQVLRNRFGVDLVSRDPKVLKGQYNLTIRSNQSLSQVMERLCILTGKHYKKEGEKQIVLY